MFSVCGRAANEKEPYILVTYLDIGYDKRDQCRKILAIRFYECRQKEKKHALISCRNIWRNGIGNQNVVIHIYLYLRWAQYLWFYVRSTIEASLERRPSAIWRNRGKKRAQQDMEDMVSLRPLRALPYPEVIYLFICKACSIVRSNVDDTLYYC